MPKPPAAFSPFAITRLIRYSSTTVSSFFAMIFRPASPIMSPIKRIRIFPLIPSPLTGEGQGGGVSALFRQLHIPAFPYHCYLDLARICQFIMYLLCHIACDLRSLCIGYVFIFYDYTFLPSGRYRVGLVYPFKGCCNLLKVFQSLDVSLKGLSPRPRPCAGQCICGSYEHTFNAVRLNIAVVRGYGILHL